MTRFLSSLLMLFVVCPFARASNDSPEFRAIWVTRYDFRSEADVRRIIDEVASLGITDVIWQVRGQADAFYESKLEPWGIELTRPLAAARPNEKPSPTSAPTQPPCDPLLVAVQAAHAKKLRIHAWFNVMPLWKGTTPPADPSHPYNAHPSWRLFDRDGLAQPLNDHYVIVNPVLPEVHDHLAAVARDIVSRYAVDGLHLDYVRFVTDAMDKTKFYPADAASISLFAKARGLSPESIDLSLKATQADFRTWVRSRITDLVTRLKSEISRARPGTVLTAAVWRTPDLARDPNLQDAASWLAEGAIDRALPMIYAADDARYQSDLRAWISAAKGRPLSPGIGAYLHAPGQTWTQVEYAREQRTDGFALFAYAAFFESVDPTQKKDEKSIRERSERLQRLRSSLNIR